MTQILQLGIACLVLAFCWLVARLVGRSVHAWLQRRRRVVLGTLPPGASWGTAQRLAVAPTGWGKDRPLHRNFGVPSARYSRHVAQTAPPDFGRPFAEMAGSGGDLPECP